MKKRLLALFMAVAMTVSVLPFPAAALSHTINNNQSDGIVLAKHAEVQSDGTVNIVIDAYTSGRVTSEASATPTDIVLVLDMSGSMDYDYSETETKVVGYDAVFGTKFENRYNQTRYGFQNGDETYYVQIGGEYYRLRQDRSSQYDNNGFAYYYYMDDNGYYRYVYPELAEGAIPKGVERQHDTVPVVLFYTANTETVQGVSRIVKLKESVNQFIDETRKMNTGLDKDDQHRISIVKYAGNSYKGTLGNTEIGNDQYYDYYYNNYYNCSQIVTDFITVDSDGAGTLKEKVEELTPGGATAVDYGLHLAEEILARRKDRSGRNQVVIVFSDGEPTYGDSYDSDVANEAIEQANALKSNGVIIYSISVHEDAISTDTDNKINKFMHYVSSNYPDATSMSNGGSRAPDSEYYMTPNEGVDLSELFDTIVAEVGRPTISLGENAVVLDKISPYFTLNTNSSEAADITIETVDYNGDEFVEDEATSPDGVSASVGEGGIISISGFNFDENYVSQEARNGNDYGCKLRVTINVSPDYDAIDRDRDELIGGAVDTNDASHRLQIRDAQGNLVAQTTSPDIVLNSIEYYLDEDQKDLYDTYYRLPGHEFTQIGGAGKTGHTFTGWITEDTDVTVEDGKFTMPDHDVVFIADFEANVHQVSYSYDETEYPFVLPELPQAQDHAYGTTVTVADPAEAPAGYTFSGWSATSVRIDKDDEFTMPDNDVVLYGSFSANADTPYRIEHYKQQLDGMYPETPDEAYNDYGTTGAEVSADAKTFTGFTYDADHEDGKSSGEITAGEGEELVLKFYYERNSYNVTYAYTTEEPNAATTLPEAATYKYGETVNVAPAATAAGYDFHGWFVGANVKDGQFTMPANDVLIQGHFVAAANTPYRVEHYFEVGDDYDTIGYPEVPQITVNLTGETNTTVTTVPWSFEIEDYSNVDVDFEGYIFHEGYDDNIPSGTISGDPDNLLVLKLYYKRASYKVTYGYQGQVPDGAAEHLPAEKTYKFGETVTVEKPVEIPGYTFNGWLLKQEEVEGTFSMPAENIMLRGEFTPNKDTKYTVEHYFEQNNGTYVLGDTTKHTATTGTTVTANPHTDAIEGYTFYPGHTDTVRSGIVAGDGSLVLKLYYQGIKYEVSYEYIGAVPADTEPADAPATKEYIQTTTVATEDVQAPAGYRFVGWTVAQGDVTLDKNGKFTMPERDVHLTGYFVGEPAKYTVKHWLQDANGSTTYNEVESDREIYDAKVGDTVYAEHNTYRGFYVRNDNVYQGEIEAGKELVLNLYYDRNSYTVYYRYHGVTPNTSIEAQLKAEKYQPKQYIYGQTVTVADELEWVPFTFHGWLSSQVDGMTEGDTQFIMPASDVYLTGYFEACREEHYTVTVVDDQVTETLHTSRYITAEPGENVTAQAISIPGYVWDPTYAGTVQTVTIPRELGDDESLPVLKLYYVEADPNLSVEKTVVQIGSTPVADQGEIPKAQVGDTIIYKIVAKNTGNVQLDVTLRDTLTEDTFYTEATCETKTVAAFTLAAGADKTVFTKYVVAAADAGNSLTNTVVAEAGGVETPPTDDVVVPVKPQVKVVYVDNDGKELSDTTDQANPFTVSGPWEVIIPTYDTETDTLVLPENTDGANYVAPIKLGELVFDHAATAEAYADNQYSYQGEVPENTTIYLIYATDKVGKDGEPGDSVPDKYQAKVNYKADNGTIVGAVDGVKSEYVTIFDVNGNWAETGTAAISGATAQPDAGAVFENWTGFIGSKEVKLVGADLEDEDETLSALTIQVSHGDVVDFTAFFRGTTKTAEKNVVYQGDTLPADIKVQDITYLVKGQKLVLAEDEQVTLLYAITVRGEAGDLFALIEEEGTQFVGAVGADGLVVAPSIPALYRGILSDEAATLYFTKTFTMKKGTHEFVNVVTIPGDPDNGIEEQKIEEEVPVLLRAVEVTKKLVVSDWDKIVHVGDEVTYEITVKNTGEVELKDIVVTDTFTKGGAKDQTWKIDTLAVGAEQVITFTYRVTKNDLDGLENKALVTAKDPDGNKVEDEAEPVETPVNRKPTRPNKPSKPKPEVLTGDHVAYVIGYPDGGVHPQGSITRAEVATIFFRLLDDDVREEYWSQTNSYSDVAATAWYNNAISTLSNMGILGGYPDGTFRPNRPITRSELTKIAVSFFEYADRNFAYENQFSDVVGNEWYAGFVAAANKLGLINGYPDGTFRPLANITRAETCAIVNRTLGRAPHKDHLLPEDVMNMWPDNMNKGLWYYADMQEATNSHDYEWVANEDADKEYEIWTRKLEERDWAALEKMWSDANSAPGDDVMDNRPVLSN